MPFGYFDDLSADENESSEEESVDQTNEEADYEQSSNDEPTRLFVHADVDCFYCQCEHKDKGIDEQQPLGIGQKHIIVTSNYAARSFGVGKLISRTEALRKCPGILIVEGSDLERYRNHSRRIYDSFRTASLEMMPKAAVRKGCMDEMALMYEISSLKNNDNNARTDDIYIYGDTPNESIRLTEDQTGAETIVRTELFRTANRNNTVFQSLLQVATFAQAIRKRILDETGFTVTMGVSTSPLLAKITSGLRKPHTVNVLEPSRADRLVQSMPLRKITGIGRQTVKALQGTLERHWKPRTGDWTCGDVLKIPKVEIAKALETLASGECDRLLDLCKGIDTSIVVDDEGCAQKTLSVENSFRRGTVRTKAQVLQHMADLYMRLPRLFEDRLNWSIRKDLAFPKTIRLTVRIVDETSGHRRPFITKSQQKAFSGHAFLKSPPDREKLLKEAVAPLLRSLLFSETSINLTRVNIALTNFQDTVTSPGRTSSTDTTKPKASSKRRRIDHFFALKR